MMESGAPGAAGEPAPQREVAPPGLIEAWRRSMFEPVRFFRDLDPEAPMARPLLYYLVVTVVAALFSTLWSLPRAETALPRELLDAVPVDPRAMLVFDFFLSPFLALLLLGAAILVVHLFVRILVPGARPMGTTARVLCYAAGPAVLAGIPVVGSLAGTVWWAVLEVIGLREAHATTTGRAAAAVLLPLLLAILLFAGLFAASLALVARIGELPVLR